MFAAFRSAVGRRAPQTLSLTTPLHIFPGCTGLGSSSQLPSASRSYYQGSGQELSPSLVKLLQKNAHDSQDPDYSNQFSRDFSVAYTTEVLKQPFDDYRAAARDALTRMRASQMSDVVEQFAFHLSSEARLAVAEVLASEHGVSIPVVDGQASKDMRGLLNPPQAAPGDRHAHDRDRPKPNKLDRTITVESRRPFMNSTPLWKFLTQEWRESAGNPTIYAWAPSVWRWDIVQQWPPAGMESATAYTKLTFAWPLVSDPSKRSMDQAIKHPLDLQNIEHLRKQLSELSASGPRFEDVKAFTAQSNFDNSGQNDDHLAQVEALFRPLGLTNYTTITTSHDAGKASQSAADIAADAAAYNYHCVGVLSPPPGVDSFDALEVWDTLCCLGLQWGGAFDVFHWVHNDATRQPLFKVFTSGGAIERSWGSAQHFPVELVVSGQAAPKDIVFSFSVPASVEAIHVHDYMHLSLLYAQERLKGKATVDVVHVEHEQPVADVIHKVKSDGKNATSANSVASIKEELAQGVASEYRTRSVARRLFAELQ